MAKFRFKRDKGTVLTSNDIVPAKKRGARKKAVSSKVSNDACVFDRRAVLAATQVAEHLTIARDNLSKAVNIVRASGPTVGKALKDLVCSTPDLQRESMGRGKKAYPYYWGSAYNDLRDRAPQTWGSDTAVQMFILCITMGNWLDAFNIVSSDGTDSSKGTIGKVPDEIDDIDNVLPMLKKV